MTAAQRGIRSLASGWLHTCRVTTRAEYAFALYAGSVADPGDRNPYAGRSMVLAKLWMRGYRRMMHVRIQTGPAMQTYLKRASAEVWLEGR